MMKTCSLAAALGLTLFSGTARAQFAVANATPVMIAPPSSTVGTIVGNTLAITPTANGFVVAGQVQIMVPPGAFFGTLLTYTVERRIDPLFASAGLQTSTVLTGFSAPPLGSTFGTSVGSVVTDWRFASGSASFVGGSQSLVPMTLVNGIDSPAWAGLTNNSVSFTGSTVVTPLAVLQQRFTLGGNQISGPGGVWTIDIPVDSILIIPEPTTATVSVLILTASACRRSRRR